MEKRQSNIELLDIDGNRAEGISMAFRSLKSFEKDRGRIHDPPPTNRAGYGEGIGEILSRSKNQDMCA